MISSELTKKNKERHFFISDLQYSTTEPQRLYGEQGPLQNLYMTHVLHTTRISYISSVMFCE